jgi:dephospho-CoA kinase
MKGMSHWKGKYVIGLTGNIATGKSVVRRMLEHLGAYGIDADRLAHRTMDVGTPGHARVVEAFGQDILDADGKVNRGRLGKLVFSDPDALRELEAIIHPLVLELIERIMHQARQPVMVIEAIKLIESGLHRQCDSLWVVDSTRDAQVQRLVQKRSYTYEEAMHRILAQPSQEHKIAQADQVILNNSDFQATWRQVKTAWASSVLRSGHENTQLSLPPGLALRQCSPEQAETIAAWINRNTSAAGITVEGLLERFAEHGYLEILWNGQTSGFLGWKVDNFIAIAFELYLDRNRNPENLLECLLASMEETACQDLCEVIVLTFPGGEARFASALEQRGYQVRPVEAPEKRAWREAAAAPNIPGSAWWKPLDNALFVPQGQAERCGRT